MLSHQGLQDLLVLKERYPEFVVLDLVRVESGRWSLRVVLRRHHNKDHLSKQVVEVVEDHQGHQLSRMIK
jgi:hypothetical protein